MKKTAKLQAKECVLEVTIQGNEQSNCVIVMLHGGPGSGMEPIMQLKAMQRLEETFTLVYFDQRGTGKSYYDIRQGISKEQVVDDVKIVVDYAKETFPNKKICLWGGSYGGLLGLMFLERFPTAVEKAVISSPAIYPSSEEMGTSQFKFLQSFENYIFPTELSKKLKVMEPSKESSYAFMTSKETQDFLNQYEMPVQFYEGLFHSNAMREWFFVDCDYRKALATIQIPTLLLQGMDDPFCFADVLIDAHRKCNNPLVSLNTYENCGHAVFDDCEDEFVRVCTEFYQA